VQIKFTIVVFELDIISDTTVILTYLQVRQRGFPINCSTCVGSSQMIDVFIYCDKLSLNQVSFHARWHQISWRVLLTNEFFENKIIMSPSNTCEYFYYKCKMFYRTSQGRGSQFLITLVSSCRRRRKKIQKFI
jgi:hypothetical protein